MTSTADATVVSTGNPYKTRMLVRRPANPQNFNGVVLVEWVNVTSGYNLDANWEFLRDYLTRAGYAWVGALRSRAILAVGAVTTNLAVAPSSSSFLPRNTVDIGPRTISTSFRVPAMAETPAP